MVKSGVPLPACSTLVEAVEVGVISRVGEVQVILVTRMLCSPMAMAKDLLGKLLGLHSTESFRGSNNGNERSQAILSSRSVLSA